MDQYLLQGLAIGIDRGDALGQVQMDGDLLLANLAARVGQSIVNDQVEIHGLGLEFRETDFQRVQLDHVFDEAADPLGGRLDALNELPLQGAEDSHRLAEQQVRVPDNG